MNRSSGFDEEDEAVVFPDFDDSTSSAYPTKMRAHEVVRDIRWIAPGETVEIGELSVSGGFFYFGDARPSHRRSIDACVIDPRAAVSDRPADAASAPGPGETSYATFTDEERRTYLEWLASARGKSGIHTRYLMFHLYGFERRVLIDGAAGKVSTEEYREMARELRRLLNIDADYSWQSHVRHVLESIDLMMSRGARMYDQSAPDGVPTGYQVPMNVRVAFGQASADKHPLPAAWALAWARLDPMMIRRTAVARCPEEFGRIFLRKYTERYKAGMLLPSNRTELDARPRPAFSALRNVPVPGFLIGLPDIAAITGPRNKLQLLMNESAAALDAYSRYLGRHPHAQGTLDATLMLPTELWPEATCREIEALAAEVQAGVRVTSFGELLGRFGSAGGLTREKAAGFCSTLARAGVGMEPDVRLGARTPRPQDALALFALAPDAPLPRVDQGYPLAALTVDLAASVAAARGARGNAGDAAIALIGREIESWPRLSAVQKTRLSARSRVQFAQPVSATGLRKKLEGLDAASKQAIAALLVRVANADGVVTREQVKLLEKIYRMLDIEAARLYADLHQDRGAEGGIAPAPKAAAVALTLDASRIAALKHETARVSAILADVFVDEPAAVAIHAAEAVRPAGEPPAMTVRPAAAAPEPAPARAVLPGLDDAHTDFLRLLVSRPSWTRAELRDAAARLELMLDGAIEQVNEASLDHWDEPLTDGDDPVEINQDLAQRLAA